MTEYSDLIYTPNEIVTIGGEYLHDKRTNKDEVIPVGIKSLDKDFLPLSRGELVSIIARPGNGKTGFMMRWARDRAQWLEERNIQNRVVVYATWEQSIEELYAFNIAADSRLSITNMAKGEITDGEWETILNSGAKRITMPLWFIGHSLKRRKKRPNLTVTALANALLEIEQWNDDKTNVDILFIDYLQRVKFDGKVESKTIGTSDVLDRLKDCALAMGCPVVVGVQAVREVDKRDVQIPTLDDGQWTSNIEQTSDRVISLVRPQKYRQEGEAFGETVVRGECQMLVSVLKQKLAKDNWAKWVYFDPAYNKLDELEERYVNFNE